MQTLSPNLPTRIVTGVRRTARRRQLILAVARLSLAALATEALFLLSVGTDRLVELPRLLKPVLPLAALLVPAAGIVGWVIALRREREPEVIAGEIDEAVPGSRDAVQSALNLRRREDAAAGSVDPFLFERLLTGAERVVAQAEPATVVGWGNTPRVVVAAALLALGIGGLWMWDAMKMPLLVQRFLHPLGNYPRPSLTEIQVAGALQRKVIQGEDLAIEALLAGRVSATERCVLHVVNGKAERLVIMTPRPGQRFDTVFKEVEHPFAFYLAAGDGRSARYRVSVEPRPTIRALQARYDYPRYTGLKPVTATVSNREIKGLEGTRVRVEFEVSLPVKESAVEFPDRKSRIRWDEARTRGSFQFTIERDALLFVRLVADSGTDNRSDPPWRVKMEPDQPPTISLSGISDGMVYYRNDVLQLSYQGGDDFGITDLYLRFYQGGSRWNRQTWPVPLERADGNEIRGQFAVPLESLTGEDDTRLEIELVAADGKGQESVTSRLALPIISDTPDRLLTELEFFHEKYAGFVNEAASTLATQAGRLGIVVDGLDANTPLRDARLKMVQEIRNELGRIALPDVFTYFRYQRQFPYTEYPYHSLRKAEDLVTAPVSLLQGDAYVGRLDRLIEDPNPKEGLAQLKALVESQGTAARQLQQALNDNLLETQLRLITVLAEQCAQNAAAGRQYAASEDAAILLAQKQDEQLKQLSALAEKVLPRLTDETAKQALEGFLGALALAPEEQAAKLPESLPQLTSLLFASSDLDGHLGASLETYYRTYPVARRVAEAERDGSLEQLQFSWQLLQQLRQDNDVLNDADLFLTARLYEALLTGDPGRRAVAVAAVTRLTPWAARYGLLDRARFLRDGLEKVGRDRQLGRVELGSPTFNRRWQELREVFLSLVRDHRAGHFAAIATEVDADLTDLAKLASAFQSWDSHAALARPEASSALDAVSAILEKLMARLAPVIDRETQDMLPETVELLRDMAAHVASLKPALAAERESLAREIANPRPAPEGQYKRYGQPYPPRVDFDRDFSRSMTCHAIAFSKIVDLRERVLLAAPTPAATADLTAMYRMFEYLVHLDNEVYNRTYKLHLDNLYIASHLYPEYLNDISQFFAEFGETATELSGWIQRVAESRGPELLADAAFTDLLARTRGQSRYAAALKAWNEEAEFLQQAQPTPGGAQRRAWLREVAEELDRALAYWEELYLAVRRVHSLLAGALTGASPENWTGLDTGTLAALRQASDSAGSLLPDGSSGSEDTKRIEELRARLDGLLPQVAVAQVAAQPPDERQRLQVDLSDCRDQWRDGLRDLEARLVVPALRLRTPMEKSASRADLLFVRSRAIRHESRWMERVIEADRRVETARVEHMVAPDSGGISLADIAWLVSRAQISRRKTAGAITQSSRSLNLEIGGGRAVPPRMPAFLFEELQRALKKPYPTQFKEPGLEYLGTLMKDAR